MPIHRVAALRLRHLPLFMVLIPLGSAVRPERAPRVVANDNRRAAGALSRDTLRLALVATLGEWHPDGDAAPGVTIPAFAEEGQAPSVPGPLLRVRAGSTVLVTVRNALPTDTLQLHGLHARPLAAAADSATIVLAPGARRTLLLTLDAPGTYYYWASTMRRALDFRTGIDAQLTGAIVVDPREARELRDARGVRTYPDRIFVLGMWTDTVARSFLPRNRVLGVVNGRSWPHGEALSVTVGDTVRWRVINASGDQHPMHLHGFYFRVTARGDGSTDTLFTPERTLSEVTEAMIPGATYAMTWVPERAGNWLYHCHIPEHFGPRAPLGLPLDSASRHRAHDAASHAMSGMNGLVMGVTVRARSARTASGTTGGGASDAGRRSLRLLVRPTVGSTTAHPTYAYAIHEGAGAEPPLDTGRVPSPTLVVTRGAPVRITVVNRLPEPTAVHWHGIELDSYFDGVPGFSGQGQRTTPLIAPGDSFVVRFKPPRAGTFIYHTHHDEDRQQAAGLAGALIVQEPGTSYDATHDIPIIFSSPADFVEATKVVFINARATPAPITVKTGERLRLRVVNMTLGRPGLRVRLLRGEVPVPWFVVAKDGAPPPAGLSAPRTASQLVSIGETTDFEFTAGEPGTLHFEVKLGPAATAKVVTVMPVHVVR
jgi:FtsP/CotA-like multicopper oxidase with cupredoxin domain